MSNRYNQAGREFVADRFIELKSTSINRKTAVMSAIESQLSQQQIQKDLDELKDALDGITSDGVITSSEKQGLKREWSALQSSYYSVAERFQASDELEQDASYLKLRSLYDALSAVMDDIFKDMSTDYIVPDDLADISDSRNPLLKHLGIPIPDSR